MNGIRLNSAVKQSKQFTSFRAGYKSPVLAESACPNRLCQRRASGTNVRSVGLGPTAGDIANVKIVAKRPFDDGFAIIANHVERVDPVNCDGSSVISAERVRPNALDSETVLVAQRYISASNEMII